MRPCVVLALLLSACVQEQAETGKRDPSIPEPILPTAAPSASAAPELAPWVSALPVVAPSVAPGDKVWATIPRSGVIPDVGVFRVEGIYDGLCSLTDGMGQRQDGVPAVLVHRAGSRGKLVEGAVVLFYTVSTPAMIGRVGKLVPGSAINVSYDWGGTTRQAAVDFAQPPIKGVRPMAFVSFPKAGRQSRGLLLALSEDRAWIRTASGHVEVISREHVNALVLSNKPLQLGAGVRAYRWAMGLRGGTVVEVVEPGLRYRVKLHDTGAIQRYFFSSIFPG